MQNKILLITNIPNPYRIPLFNQLKSDLEEANHEFKVVFAAGGYKRRCWELNLSECEFEFEVLKSKRIKLGNVEKTMFSYAGLLKLINREKPELIIIIGYSFGTLKLFLRSIFIKTRYLIWSGSLIRKGRYDSFLRILFRKILVSRAVGFIAYGQKAKQYLISLGAPEEKIQIAINTVDAEYFASRATKIRKETMVAQSLKHLTFVGYLSPRKNVMRVLEIVKLLFMQRSDFVLDIVGDGTDRKRLEKYVKDYNLEKVVLFHGFRQKHELPELFSISNCFLFQTDFDIWGLVLNEAMAAGLPCISSIHAGATWDLIREGETGFAVDFNDTEKVIERIHWILENPIEARRIGDNAARYIQKNASLKASTMGFTKAIIDAIG